MDGKVTEKIIRRVLERIGGYRSIYIPEFTYGGLRIDGIVINTDKRWIRGFEIKMSRADFLRDEKWHRYSEFCSSLSMVCPAHLIEPKEIPKEFGLLWIRDEHNIEWVKKAKRFQKRDAMAWTYKYLDVLESEFPRIITEKERLQGEMEYWKERCEEINSEN